MQLVAQRGQTFSRMASSTGPGSADVVDVETGLDMMKRVRKNTARSMGSVRKARKRTRKSRRRRENTANWRQGKAMELGFEGEQMPESHVDLVYWCRAWSRYYSEPSIH